MSGIKTLNGDGSYVTLIDDEHFKAAESHDGKASRIDAMIGATHKHTFHAGRFNRNFIEASRQLLADDFMRAGHANMATVIDAGCKHLADLTGEG